MSSPPPALVRLKSNWLRALERIVLAAEPEEGCALLLGRWLESGSGAGLLHLSEIWPCLNIWEPKGERRQRFLIDPREQLLAQRWARQRGVQVLGSVHSHPASPPKPSATDLALAFTPTLLLIRSGLAAAGGDRDPDPLENLRAWWLAGDGAAPLALEIRISP